MNKEQKVNWIKCWLQKFGNRDNETFHIEVVVGDTYWELSLQYGYDFDGDRIDPNDWCCSGFKHLHNNKISDRTDGELDRIIDQLKLIKEYH
jgi:hypothetical protein